MDVSAESATADSGSPENLGARLRSAREAKKLSLDAVAADLRIEPANLLALEECRFEALGAPVFAKGYLKQYGARLGLDVAELVADYNRAQGDKRFDIAPSRTIRLRDERQITIWIIAGLALIVLAALLALWWLKRPAPESGEVAGAPAASPLRSTGDDAAPEALAVTTAAAAGVRAARDPDPVTSPVTAGPAFSDTPVSDTVAEPPRGTSQADIPESATESPDVAVAGPALEIRFNEDSWTEISDLDGRRLYYDLGRAGTRTQLPLARGLSLFFGNGAGIELRLDDQPYAIPASARRGDYAEFDIQPVAD